MEDRVITISKNGAVNIPAAPIQMTVHEIAGFSGILTIATSPLLSPYAKYKKPLRGLILTSMREMPKYYLNSTIE